MNHRSIIALGFLLLSVGYFLRSLHPANALAPSPYGMSNSGVPYQSFSGEIQGGQTLTLLAVPSDKVFIITMAVLQEYTLDIYEDSLLKMEGDSYASFHGYSHRVMVTGNGQLPISPGSSLKLVNSYQGSAYRYYIEGYYADAADSPFVSHSGEMPSSGQVDLLTVPSDQVFIITGFSQGYSGGGNIDILDNGTTVFDAFPYGGNGGMGRGRGHLVISSGSVLRLQGSQGKDYYLQGYYAQP